MTDHSSLPTRPVRPFSVGVFAAVSVAIGSLWFANAQPVLLSLVLYLNLAVLAFYDYHFFRLPNLLTLSLFVTGAISVVLVPRYPPVDHGIGAIVGLLFFPLLNAVYQRIRGRVGIGFGDAKMLSGLGLWLGWQTLPTLLLVAAVSGLFAAFLVPAFRQEVPVTSKMAVPIPFGMFLALAGWICWLFL